MSSLRAGHLAGIRRIGWDRARETLRDNDWLSGHRDYFKWHSLDDHWRNEIRLGLVVGVPQKNDFPPSAHVVFYIHCPFVLEVAVFDNMMAFKVNNKRYIYHTYTLAIAYSETSSNQKIHHFNNFTHTRTLSLFWVWYSLIKWGANPCQILTCMKRIRFIQFITSTPGYRLDLL